MSRRSKMGEVLRAIRGNDMPVIVTARLTDFNVVELEGPGEMGRFPANTLFAFTAVSFSEVCDEAGEPVDVWQFRISEPSAAGPVMSNIFVSGDDIFVIKQMSKVVG